MSYDTAITVFSPDGHLFQVEYAQEAVKKGSTAVGIRGLDVVVLGVERKTIATLQENWSVRKIALLDDHIAFTFAGLTADARVLMNKARVECQSHRLSIEDPVRVEYITKYISSVQQIFTQGSGRRPFGLSTLITGFDPDGSAHLYQTDPSGTYNEWKANVIGRNAKSVREFLEKRYNEDIAKSDRECIKLCIRTLLEVVQATAQNVEVLVMYRDRPAITLDDDEVHRFMTEIEKDKADEAAETATTSR